MANGHIYINTRNNTTRFIYRRRITMKVESISAKTGKLTAKTLGAIKAAPKKTGNKTKSVKEAFVSGYQTGK